MTRVLFRVDAGAGIGLGHLARCQALAHALMLSGAECLFLTSPQVQKRVAAQGSRFFSNEAFGLGDAEDLRQTFRLARTYGCQVIVVDSYRVDADYLATLRGEDFFVVMIDDLAAFPFPCQLVVNGSLYADCRAYVSSSGDTEFLLGPEYIMLRPEFWNVSLQPLREPAENLLILLGGFDPLDLMPGLLAALEDVPGELHVTAVVGPFFENRREIETMAQKSRHRIEAVYSPLDVRGLITDADAAISAGGQTIHELLVCGCPTVALAVAENQLPNVRAWAERGAVLTVNGTEAAIDLKETMQQVRALMISRPLREKLRETGRALIDGQGAKRIGQRILASIPEQVG